MIRSNPPTCQAVQFFLKLQRRSVRGDRRFRGSSPDSSHIAEGNDVTGIGWVGICDNGATRFQISVSHGSGAFKGYCDDRLVNRNFREGVIFFSSFGYEGCDSCQ